MGYVPPVPTYGYASVVSRVKLRFTSQRISFQQATKYVRPVAHLDRGLQLVLFAERVT